MGIPPDKSGQASSPGRSSLPTTQAIVQTNARLRADTHRSLSDESCRACETGARQITRILSSLLYITGACHDNRERY